MKFHKLAEFQLHLFLDIIAMVIFQKKKKLILEKIISDYGLETKDHFKLTKTVNYNLIFALIPQWQNHKFSPIISGLVNEANKVKQKVFNLYYNTDKNDFIENIYLALKHNPIGIVVFFNKKKRRATWVFKKNYQTNATSLSTDTPTMV